MTARELQGRRFLVTGANSGIGRALAEALAARRRLGGARRPVGGADAARARRHPRAGPGADVEFLHVDLSDLGSVRRAAGAYLATGRPLDVLVNNAGVAGTRALSPKAST